MNYEIPTQHAIDGMIAGPYADSRYQRARHEVWATIRRAHEQAGADVDLSEAVEAAQALDRNVPAQQGSALDIAQLRDEALSAVAAVV